MTQEELITKQQLEIERYKQIFKEDKSSLLLLLGNFYSIGAPLNDNMLSFNKDQLLWCSKIAQEIESLNILKYCEEEY